MLLYALKKKKKKEGFKNQEKKLKIIKLVLLAPNEIKNKTGF